MSNQTQNLDAEMALVGSAMLSAKASQSVSWVTPGMFFQPAHAEILDAIRAIYAKGAECDLVLLKDVLNERNQLKEIGGVEYLIKCGEAVGLATNATYYAEIVRECWARREMISRATLLIDYAKKGELKDAVGTGSTILKGLLDSMTFEIDIADAVKALPVSVKSGIASPFPRVNRRSMAGGFYRGESNIVAAKRGGRKSLLLCQFTKDACQQGLRGAFVSLEMDAETLVRRILRQITTCKDFNDAQYLGESFVKEYQAAQFDMSLWDLLIYDTTNADVGADTIEAVRDWILAKHTQKPLDFVCIDYVQLLGTTERLNGDRERNQHVARVLRRLAKACDYVPVYAAQMQEFEGNKYVRHSSEWEDGAGQVFVMYEESGKTIMRNTKNRHGEGFYEFELAFNPISLVLSEAFPE